MPDTPNIPSPRDDGPPTIASTDGRRSGAGGGLKDGKVSLPLKFLDDLSRATGGAAVLAAAVRWLPQMLPALRASGAYMDGSDMCAFVNWADGRVDPISALQPALPKYAAGAEFRLDRRVSRLSSVDLSRSKDPKLQRLYKEGVQSLLMMPLMLGNMPMGLLTVGTEDPAGYTPEHGVILRVVGRCITAQLDVLQQVRNTARLAETDPLTGLANRARLMRFFGGSAGALHLPDKSGQHLGLLHIDLDGFKEVNDTLGHGVGDALLEQVAEVMRHAAGPRDLIARVGGDEFVVVTRTDMAGEALEALGQTLVCALESPFDIDGAYVQIGASVGAAIADRPGLTATRLIANADLALYEAKRNGKGQVASYTDQLRAESNRRAQLMADLRTAAESGTENFTPFFQPRMDVQTGQLLGLEALARWPHERYGCLAPAGFLELAREARALSRIDDVVRGKALIALQSLRQEGWDLPWVSVNLSCESLSQPSLPGRLSTELQCLDLAASDLRLEVREADLAEIGLDLASRRLSALRAAGFAIELDDFGVGLASTAILTKIDVQTIKLHETIVSELPNPRSETILKATIALAHELEISTVAEGVETEEQLQRLRVIGCDAAQGYVLERPMPTAKLTEFLDRCAAQDSPRVAVA